MNEKLLHFIWKFRLFNQDNLSTTTSEPVALVNTGTHNIHSGADFQNAKLRIGDTLWAGNVEIHINSADWFTHRHQDDDAYKNVILHVVYDRKGKQAAYADGKLIPTLELKERINPATLQRYQLLSEKKEWIPCAKFFKEIDEFKLKSLQERLLVERLEAKVEQVNELLKESGNDWENVMFQSIAKYLGAGINKEPFLQLAKSLPVMVWAKYSNDPLQLAALVFGQAGLLEEKFDDDYPNQLRKEYNYLKRLHQLQPLEKQVWKFLRLRPSNFPTVRLAQLAALMSKEVKLFSAIKDAANARAIVKLLDADVNEYWQTHYRFDKPAKKANTHIGAAMRNILLINAVAPVLFAYGKHIGKEDYCDKAIALLEACEPESNSIISGWGKLGLKPSNAFDSQSLLQLKNEYCSRFRCLDCAVGHAILK